MDHPTPSTPDQVAERLLELAAQIETQAFPRHQMAEGFRLMANLLAPPVDVPGDSTGHA